MYKNTSYSFENNKLMKINIKRKTRKSHYLYLNIYNETSLIEIMYTHTIHMYINMNAQVVLKL